MVAIAWIAVSASIKLALQKPVPKQYLLDEAVQYVADCLPTEVANRVDHDDVSTVLEWHLDWFIEVGLGAISGTLLGDSPALTGEVTVGDADAAIDAVVARALEAGGPESIDVVCILNAHNEYLLELGALTVDTGARD